MLLKMNSFEFDRVFRPIIFVFRLVGLWPNGNRSIIYAVYGAVICTVFPFALTLVEFIQMINFTEHEQITDAMFMALTELAVLIKYVNFYCHWRSMHELYETAKKFQLETKAEEKLLNERMRFNFWIVLLLFTSMNMAHMGAEIKTILSPELLLPFPAWYPHSWIDGDVKYWFTYAHNAFSHFLGSNLVSAVDGFPTSLLFIVSVQMEIFGCRMKMLGHDGTQADTEHETKRDKQGRNLRQLERIKKCIQTHIQILEFSIYRFLVTH